MSDLTRLLERVDAGEPRAADELLPLVYDELRRLAAHKMALQPPGQTLQATALVHEAYLRLAGGDRQAWQNQKHFFAAAAEAMRHILIARARKRVSRKHGGGAEHVDLEALDIAAPAKDEILLRLNEALDELQEIAPVPAEIVKLRFFVGASEAEIATVLQLSERSVQRHWRYAKSWLFERIEKSNSK